MKLKQKLHTFKHVNERGTAHVIVMALAVVFVGAIGTYLIVKAHATTITGTTYYVSPTGEDSNNGLSQTAPWKTIGRLASQKFKAGDAILFQGGGTFSGMLYFPSSEQGTSTSPIRVSSYGTGRATLNGGTGSAIYAYDTAGFKITNLILTGSGASTNNGAGINFYNDLNTGSPLNYVSVANVRASGFKNGMALGGVHGGNGYSSVTVANATFSNNRMAGLATYGPSFNATSPTYANRRVTIKNVTAFGNQGDATLTGSNDSGSGIVLGSVDGGNVSYSDAYNNGSACTASACGVGIWTYDSNNVVIQHSISHGNHTGSFTDGDGFDLDQNTSNSTLQYNYSYNNAGAGLLLFGASADQSHTSNTVRFNISQNDGQKNTEAGIVVYGNVNQDAIYNNTIYVSPTTSGGNPTDIRIFSIGDRGQNTVRNNIFYAAGDQWPAVVAPNTSTTMLDFQDNDYYAASSFHFYWGSTTYTSLSGLQSATGQEKQGSELLGYASDPSLAAAGSGVTLTNPATLSQLTQYQLTNTSSLKDKGLNLTSLYGTNMGGSDFYGAAVPTSLGVSIGAAEN